MKRLPCISILVLASSCGDPLVAPQTVTGLRVLGARVSALAAPARAHIEAEEDATIEWLVLAERTRSFSGLGLWCAEQHTSVGAPPCVDPFRTEVFEGDSDHPVSLSFTLPSSLDDSPWVHWLGLCEKGTPTWNAEGQRFECSKGEPISAVYRGNVSESNLNPDLEDDLLTFNDATWSQSASADSPPTCDDATVPSLDIAETAVIRLRAKGTDREKLTSSEYAAATRESIAYTHVTTWPGLERAYSVIEGTSTDTAFSVKFTGDGTPRAGGELIRFALVARDGRGGSDWLERWFCSKP